jgi:hypothetical protein
MVDVELDSPTSRDIGPAYLTDPALCGQHLIVIIPGHAELVFQMTASDYFRAFLQVLSLIRQHLFGVFSHIARMGIIAAFFAAAMNSSRPVATAVELPVGLRLLAFAASLLWFRFPELFGHNSV